jgi:hypothetical protein
MPGCFHTLPVPKFIVLVHKITPIINPLPCAKQSSYRGKPCLELQDDLRKQLAARETHQKRCPRAGPLRCNRPREEVVEVEVFPSLPRLQLPFSE